MALSYPETTGLTERIIGAAIEVHKHMGPGLMESTYEECLCWELNLSGHRLVRQPEVPIVYKGHSIGSCYRADLVVEGQVVVEVKSVEKILAVHQAQLLTYLRLTQIKLGLLFNFNTATLASGIKRLSL